MNNPQAPTHIDRDDLATYAVGALPADEAEVVAAHVKECETCAEALAEYAETVSALAVGLEEMPTREALRARILTSLEGRDGLAAPTDITLERSRRRAPFGNAGYWVATAAAAVALAFLGFLTIDARNDANDARDRVNEIEEKITEGQVLTMRGSEEAPDASVALIIAPDGRSATIIARNLPETSGDSTYVLWLFEGGQPQNVTSFDIKEGETLEVEIDGDVLASDAMAVTLESDPDVDQPEGPVFVSGELT